MARLIFFGNERLATGVSTTAPVLRALIEAGHDILAVVANQSDRQSRRERELEIASVAQEHDIPVWMPEKPADIIDRLGDVELGVLVAYGKLIPQPLIDAIPHGIINLHPSLLPKHRGPTPLESVILSGEATTGVSIMRLGAQMDAGPIWEQAEVAVMPDESKQVLADRLLARGRELMVATTRDVLDHQRQPTPQDESAATYDNLITKADGLIHWDEPAEIIERRVRAYLGWPGARTTLDGAEVTITSAHAVAEAPGAPGEPYQAADGALVVSTGRGSLVVDTLVPAGKRQMTGRAWLTGHPLS